MRTVGKGAAALGGLYAGLIWLAMLLDDYPSALSLIRPVLLQWPVAPLFAAYRLHDDDPRIIGPILIATILWGKAGGAAAVLWSRWAARARGRHRCNRLRR